jgi:uncharacterized protein YijF (DUF1287 family)
MNRLCINSFISGIAMFLVCFCFIGGAKAQSNFQTRLADSAFTLTFQNVTYLPAYVVIPYPNGDVPPKTGVCSDVVIRAYRKLGIDLQKEVHLDMVSNFSQYPKLWNMKKPDSNIDHRRVPNLMTYFKRHGLSLKITKKPNDYSPGDIVCWKLEEGITHIGLVSNRLASDGETYQVIHNIGNGQQLEDCLFDFTIIGHYRYSK